MAFRVFGLSDFEGAFYLYYDNAMYGILLNAFSEFVYNYTRHLTSV